MAKFCASLKTVHSPYLSPAKEQEKVEKSMKAAEFCTMVVVLVVVFAFCYLSPIEEIFGEASTPPPAQKAEEYDWRADAALPARERIARNRALAEKEAKGPNLSDSDFQTIKVWKKGLEEMKAEEANQLKDLAK